MTETDAELPAGFAVESVRDDEMHVEPGSDAQFEHGVQYQGSYESDSDGNARAVRLHALALASAGEPVLLQSFTNTFIDKNGARVGAEAMERAIREEVGPLRTTSVRQFDVRIKHMVIAGPDQIRFHVVPRSVMIERDIETAMATTEALFKSCIIYSVWERTKLDPEVAALLARVGECWVPCQQNADLLRAHGVERVVVIPHPWQEDSQIAKCTSRRYTGFDRDGRHERSFYSIGLWQPRKGFHETIGAFLYAYKPGDRAKLTIKHIDTKFPNYPRPQESVEHWLADPNVKANGWTIKTLEKHLWLPGGHWAESEIIKLHFNSNIYVSASHGEGFGMPAFDAKVAGNRLIHVPFGGTHDFSDPAAGDIAIPCSPGPVPKEYGWGEGAEWADYQFSQLVTALTVVIPPDEYRRGPALEGMKFQAVGALMRQRVNAVRKAKR